MTLQSVLKVIPKEEYVDLLATHCILLTVDSAIKFVNFNEQESHALYKLKNDLQKRYDVINFIYREKLDQYIELNNAKKNVCQK